MVEHKAMHKSMILAAAGIGLQTVGNICLLIASVMTAQAVNKRIKQTIIKELEKQLNEK